MKAIIRQIKCILVVILNIVCLTSCGKGSDKLVYKYDNPKVCDGFDITKSVYEDDTLKVYFQCDRLNEDCTIACYNDSFEQIDEAEYEYQFKNGVLVIEGECAGEISGLTISEKYDRYYNLRYLNSEQFACLYYCFADDLGYEEYGDREAYYTSEELERFEHNREETEQRMAEAFSMIEGNWGTKDGLKKLSFYQDEKSDYIMETRDFNEIEDAWTTNTETLVSVSADEVDGIVEIEVIFNAGELQGCFYYELKQDKTILCERYTDIEYVRE